MITIGIDPGIHGAIAIYKESELIAIHDMPIHTLVRNGKSKGEIDLVELARIIDAASKDGKTTIWLERVNAMPGQGVSSVFSLGHSFGGIRGVVSGLFLSLNLVTPQAWKKALNVPADKDGSRARASQLMPQNAHYWPLKKHDGRAEAAMIGLYGLRQLSN